MDAWSLSTYYYTTAMKPFIILSLISVLSAPVTSHAETLALPKADANGNYLGKIGHYLWVVVDPDPKGLNCRWSNRIHAGWQSPAAVWPEIAPKSWPVVRRFSKGSILNANGDTAGFAVLADAEGRPWLKVSIGAENQICLVRAHNSLIRPILN